MALDITNGISLKITDGISVSIPNKLKAIATDSRTAADNVADLQTKLNSIQAAGVSSLATSMRSTAAATGTLSSNTDKYANAAGKAVAATNNFASSLGKLEAQAALAAANIAALQQATLGYNTAARSVVATSNVAATSQTNLGRATSSTISATQAASADIGLLEGRMLSANRAAAGFAVKILGLGPALQAAFVVTGAIALLEVLIQVGQGINNIVRAYKDMQLASAKASIQAIEDGEKIIKVHSSILTAANAARLIAGRGSDFGGVTQVTQVAPLIEQATATQAVAAAQRNLNEAGLKGAALQAQKRTDALADVQDLQNQRAAIQKVADQLKAQREEQVKSNALKVSFSGANFDKNPFDLGLAAGVQPVTTNKVTDPAAVKEIEKNFKSATDEVKRLDTAITVMKLNAQADTKREAVAQIKDDAHAATLEMKAFEDQLANMRKGDQTVSPQATLAFWQKAAQSAMPQNKDAIDSKEGNAQQAIDRQADAIKNLSDKLTEQVADIGLYSNALAIKRDVDKDVLALTKESIQVNDALTASITAQVTQIVEQAKYSAALKTQYEEFRGPAEAASASIRAATTLFLQGATSQEEFARTTALARQQLQDSIDPLNSYSRALQQQRALASTRGTSQEQETNNAVVGKSNELQNQGFDKATADKMAESKRADIALTNQQKEAQQAYNAIIESQTGVLQRLAVQQAAVIQARKDGIITDDVYNAQMNKITNDVITQHEIMGDATWEQQAKGALASYASSYEGFAKSTGDLYKQTFKTIADGAADSIGRAIVYAKNLDDALKDVARQALQEIISGMIKIAIQWAITKFFHQKPDDASTKQIAVNTAASLGAITAITAAQAVAIDLLSEPAWDLAEAVSIFSFGAADAAAITGMAAVKTAGTAAGGFAGGGYVSGPGTATSDSISARLSNGEYVWDAKTTAANYNVIAGIHKGNIKQFASGGFVGSQSSQRSQSSGGGNITVEYHDHVGVAIQTQRVSETRVRMIVTEMGQGIVAQHAPSVIANEFQNPNSSPSKAVSRNITPARMR